MVRIEKKLIQVENSLIKTHMYDVDQNVNYHHLHFKFSQNGEA